MTELTMNEGEDETCLTNQKSTFSPGAPSNDTDTPVEEVVIANPIKNY